MLPRLRSSLQAVEKCHGDAMTSLSLASGSGDDGVMPEEVRMTLIMTLIMMMYKVRSDKEPITQMVRVRVAHAQNSGARQVAEEGGCVELERMWVEFNSSASATATNLNNPVNVGPANSTQDILEAICARCPGILWEK